MGHVTIVRDQPGIASRAVPLASHPTALFIDPPTLEVSRSEGHSQIAFHAYWTHLAVFMSHGELAQIRDAINAVLAAEIPAEAEADREPLAA